MSNIDELVKIERAVIEFCLECVRNRIGHMGTGKGRTMFEIRDSLIYRTSAVNWHLTNLKSLHKSLEEKLLNAPHSSINDPSVMRSNQYQIYFLFDDIIFNLASMFDYLGNLIGLAYIGPNKNRMKWNGITKCFRDPKNKLSELNFAKNVIEINNKWVNHLMSYRGDSVHHKIDMGGAQHTWEYSENEISININIDLPNSLAKKLFNEKDKSVCLIEASSELVEKSAKHCSEVLLLMKRELKPDYCW